MAIQSRFGKRVCMDGGYPCRRRRKPTAGLSFFSNLAACGLQLAPSLYPRRGPIRTIDGVPMVRILLVVHAYLFHRASICVCSASASLVFRSVGSVWIHGPHQSSPPLSFHLLESLPFRNPCWFVVKSAVPRKVHCTHRAPEQPIQIHAIAFPFLPPFLSLFVSFSSCPLPCRTFCRCRHAERGIKKHLLNQPHLFASSPTSLTTHLLLPITCLSAYYSSTNTCRTIFLAP